MFKNIHYQVSVWLTLSYDMHCMYINVDFSSSRDVKSKFFLIAVARMITSVVQCLSPRKLLYVAVLPPQKMTKQQILVGFRTFVYLLRYYPQCPLSCFLRFFGGSAVRLNISNTCMSFPIIFFFIMYAFQRHRYFILKKK